jgi:hypothetical protein
MVDFEVTMDPIEEAQAIGLLMDPERHHIMPDGEWVAWLKRMSGRKDLFLYRHLDAGTFVLAVWVIPGKVATELMSFEFPPDHYADHLPSREEMQMRLRPADMQIRQMKADFRAMASARKQSRLEAAEASKDAARHLRRKGLDEAAMGVESVRPWTGEDASSEASVFDGIGKVMA